MGRNTGTGLTGHPHTRSTSPRRRRRTRRGRRAAALAVLATLATAAACSSNDDESASFDPPSTEAPADFPADEPVAESEPVDGADVGAPPGSNTASAPAAGIPLDNTFGRDLAIEMGLTMSTSDVADTVAAVNRLTDQFNGRVLNADVRIEAPLEDGSIPGGGSMLIGVAPDDLPGLIDALGGVARISDIRQDTEDVTEQLIDLEIRIRQARTGIANIEALYAQATEFSDLVEIEQELARRQIELERLLASQRGVEGRVEMSRLTVIVEYEAPVPEEAVEEPVDEESDDRGIADAFRDGWDAFAGVMFAVGFVLAVAAPFLAPRTRR